MPDNEGTPTPGGSSTTLEEFEAHVAAPTAAPKASEFKLEGDDIPEEFRGKTAAEVVKEAKAFQNALRMSEDARTSQRAALEARSAEPAAPKVVEEPAEEVMTREQLAELAATDPVAAMEKVTEIAEKRAEKNFNARLARMDQGNASLAQDWAKQEFPDEFQLFGAELDTFVKKFPPETFSTKKGWEDAISYVRGQRGNFEKLMEHRQKGPAKGAVEARMEQERESGHSGGNGVQRGRIPAAQVETLDAVQDKIAQEFIDTGVFKDKAEYIRWSKIGG
jgi:hypothetical protein